MIEPFIIAGSCENAKHLYIIRTSPSIEEQELFARYKADYIELDHIWEKRDINDEEWDRIVVRHEMYIKRIRPRIENAEKW
ncbi:MAG TPA: hypothetical protein DCZ91_17130 [Lachnospiraceae bacterium]|nr:hypothetical protein [Lachnospiraceae bacterium]